MNLSKHSFMAFMLFVVQSCSSVCEPDSIVGQIGTTMSFC
jgi:hypothetical protein